MRMNKIYEWIAAAFLVWMIVYGLWLLAKPLLRKWVVGL